eukprot:712739-Pleurochrysis_carterae.AAC.3
MAGNRHVVAQPLLDGAQVLVEPPSAAADMERAATPTTTAVATVCAVDQAAATKGIFRAANVLADDFEEMTNRALGLLQREASVCAHELQ